MAEQVVDPLASWAQLGQKPVSLPICPSPSQVSVTKRAWCPIAKSPCLGATSSFFQPPFPLGVLILSPPRTLQTRERKALLDTNTLPGSDSNLCPGCLVSEEMRPLCKTPKGLIHLLPCWSGSPQPPACHSQPSFLFLLIVLSFFSGNLPQPMSRKPALVCRPPR